MVFYRKPNYNFSVVHITPNGKIRLPKMDVSELLYEFADEIGRDIVYEPRDD